MSRRRTIGLPALLILASVLALGAMPFAWGNGPAAQIDPTQQQQTIEAIIAERFTQTAVVQQQLGMTQTAEAATLFAPTLTAAFIATVDAAFNQALTATAAPLATATAEALGQTMPGLLAALNAVADERSQAITQWLGENQVTLEVLMATNDLSTSDSAALGALLPSVLAGQDRFRALFVYDVSGRVLATAGDAFPASSVADQPYFRASLLGPLTQPPVLDASGELTMLVTRPVFADSGQTVGVLAGVVDLSTLAALFAAPTTYERQLTSILGVTLEATDYLVAGATHTALAPAEWSALPPLESSGIARALAGENGTATYNDVAGTPVVGAFRWVPALNAALLVEVPLSRAVTLAAALPTPTPTPTITPTPLPASATPRPEIFPTNTVAQVQIAEQVFEHGRMFWIRHTRQIWVMVNVPPDAPGGDWFCYNDTFEEGEPEIDPSLVPPEGLYQPRRGFGKLWRNRPELKSALGWAVTPEFELTSNYTYIAGGYAQDNQYFPGPGEHRLTTLYNESISFFEQDIRGDCLGGTWRMTGVP